MIIPVRCFSCGRPVAQKWEEFQKRVGKGESKKKILDDLGIESYCCRALFLGHVDLIDTAAQFKKF
jgi:DNA-directed RNA polymerase subunit N